MICYLIIATLIAAASHVFIFKPILDGLIEDEVNNLVTANYTLCLALWFIMSILAAPFFVYILSSPDFVNKVQDGIRDKLYS